MFPSLCYCACATSDVFCHSVQRSFNAVNAQPQRKLPLSAVSSRNPQFVAHASRNFPWPSSTTGMASAEIAVQLSCCFNVTVYLFRCTLVYLYIFISVCCIFVYFMFNYWCTNLSDCYCKYNLWSSTLFNVPREVLIVYFIGFHLQQKHNNKPTLWQQDRKTQTDSIKATTRTAQRTHLLMRPRPLTG